MTAQPQARVYDVADPNKPPKLSPMQKLKDSVTTLQEENDRMKREIERGGGDLWSAQDRPRDIAKVIFDKVGKSKAEQVARAILKIVSSQKATQKERTVS